MKSYFPGDLFDQLGAILESDRGRPIAIFPGGRFTRMLLERARPGVDMPCIACVLDDSPSDDRIAGIPVYRPEEVDPRLVGAVVVATEAVSDAIERRANEWANTVPPDQRPAVRVLRSEASSAVVEPTPAFASVHPHAPDGTFPARLDVNGYEHHVGDGYVVQRSEWTTRGFVRFPRVQTMPGSPLRRKDRLDVREYPTRREPGLITPETPVSVLGSCFAERLREWLIARHYNYCQWEDGPGVYGSLNASAIYNSGSLRQLFEWAFTDSRPQEEVWVVDGTLTDPYRQFMCWPDEASMRAEREAHRAATRRLVAGSRVLILTLGMSEVWRNRHDRSCFAWLPPKAVLDPDKHECVLLTPDENLQNLESVRAICAEHNPDLRLVVSLSPVPIIATQFDRHVMVSDTASKASLRSAIEMFCQRHPEVVYFPSYEMVARSPRWSYAKDNWHVTDPAVISAIMEGFIGTMGASESAASRNALASATVAEGTPAPELADSSPRRAG